MIRKIITLLFAGILAFSSDLYIHSKPSFVEQEQKETGFSNPSKRSRKKARVVYPRDSESLERVVFVRAKKWAPMDSLMEMVEKTDLQALFPDYRLFKVKSCMLTVSDNLEDAEAPIYKRSIFSPDTIRESASGIFSLALEEMRISIPGVKYCFAYGNRLMYTDQWIEPLFDYAEMPIRMFLEFPGSDEPSIIWKEVFKGNGVIKRSVILSLLNVGNDWAYDLDKNEYYKIKYQ